MRVFFKDLNEQSGMSMVEVLAAIAIFALCATVFIGALSAGSVSANTQGEQVIASNLAQSQMENIKAAAYDSSGVNYAVISAPLDFSIAISTNSNVYSDANIQKITVTISHSGTAVLNLEDYKVNR